MKLGRLLLVPAPLDFGCTGPLPPITDTLPLGTLQQMARLRYWVCENAKTLRALLKRVDAVIPLETTVQDLKVVELPRAVHKKGDHDGGQDALAKSLLQPALDGNDLGLCSEAGMPAVADPGSSLVRAAHAAGIVVIPLTGPSALLLAVAASGLNGQQFAFAGYLPQDAAARTQKLKELEMLAHKTGQTQLWIETPYRNQALLQHTLQVLQPATRLCVASGLTLQDMVIFQDRVSALRQSCPELPTKIPAVFALGK